MHIAHEQAFSLWHHNPSGKKNGMQKGLPVFYLPPDKHFLIDSKHFVPVQSYCSEAGYNKKPLHHIFLTERQRIPFHTNRFQTGFVVHSGNLSGEGMQHYNHSS